MSRPQLMWSSTTLSNKSQDAQTTPLRSLQGLTSRVRSSRSNARSQAARSQGPHHTTSWVTGYMWVLLQDPSVFAWDTAATPETWLEMEELHCSLYPWLTPKTAPGTTLMSAIFHNFHYVQMRPLSADFFSFVGFVSQIFVVAITDVSPVTQNFHCTFNAF